MIYRWAHWSHADKGEDFARCDHCDEVICYWKAGLVTTAGRKKIEKHLAPHEEV